MDHDLLVINNLPGEISKYKINTCFELVPLSKKTVGTENKNSMVLGRTKTTESGKELCLRVLFQVFFLTFV